MGDSEVTQELWQEVMGKNPSEVPLGPQLPVNNTPPSSLPEFIKALNQKVPGLTANIPSEAQWEYACRAGTQTPFSAGPTVNLKTCNYDGHLPYGATAVSSSKKQAVPVKSLPPNPWGIYEMHGNVIEMTRDGYTEYPLEPVFEPGGMSGQVNIMRGGSWQTSAKTCRSAARNTLDRRYGVGDVGLRLMVPGS